MAGSFGWAGCAPQVLLGRRLRRQVVAARLLTEGWHLSGPAPPGRRRWVPHCVHHCCGPVVRPKVLSGQRLGGARGRGTLDHGGIAFLPPGACLADGAGPRQFEGFESVVRPGSRWPLAGGRMVAVRRIGVRWHLSHPGAVLADGAGHPVVWGGGLVVRPKVLLGQVLRGHAVAARSPTEG